MAETAEKMVCLNASTFEELKGLPGIGIQYAQQIINLRKLSARPIVIGDFHEHPKIQTVLHKLQVDGLLVEDLDLPAGDYGVDPVGDAEQIPAWYRSSMDLLLKRMDARDRLTNDRVDRMVREQNERFVRFESRMELRFGQPTLKAEPVDMGVPVSSDVAPKIPTYGLAAGDIQSLDAAENYQFPKRNPEPSPTADDVRRQVQVIEGVEAKYIPPHIRNMKQPVSTGSQPHQMQSSTSQLGSTLVGNISAARSGVSQSPGSAGHGIFGERKVYHPKIAPYTGSTDFFAFSKKFDLMASAYGWSEEVKLLKLVENLTDGALDLYRRQSDEVSSSFVLLKEALCKAFGKEDDPYLHRSEIGAILQCSDESLEQFGRRVRELSAKAYSVATPEMLEILATDAFLKGCSDLEAVKLAMVSQPKTLSEAIKYTRQNSYFDLMARKHKSRARRVTIKDDEATSSSVRQVQTSSTATELTEVIKSIDVSLKRIFDRLDQRGGQVDSRPSRASTSDPPVRREGNRSISPRRSPSPGHNRCFNCDEEGHSEMSVRSREDRPCRARGLLLGCPERVPCL